MERRDAAVRRPGDVKLVVLDFVVRQNHLQKFRKDARAVLEEQLTVRRRRSDDDVAALLGLGAEVAAEHAVHRVHRLRTAAEGQDRGIRRGRIVAVRQDDLVVDGRAHLLRLLHLLRVERSQRDIATATAPATTARAKCVI